MNATELMLRQKAIHEKMDNRAKVLGYGEDIAPVYDGVKDINGYLHAKCKILWVMKEPYDEIIDGKPMGGGWFMADFTLELPMFRTMAKIVYGIVNEKYFDEIPEPDDEMLKLLQTTAYINICKMPGLSTSNKSDLKKKFLDWADIIHNQIDDTYQPDIIILGNTYEDIMEGRMQDNPTTDWVEEASIPGTVAVYKTRSSRIIVDAFHPSPMRKCTKSDLSDERYINSIIQGTLIALHK